MDAMSNPIHEMTSENVLHTLANAEYFKCKVCRKTYSAKKNLKRHVILSHPNSAEGKEYRSYSQKVYPFQCIICNKYFSKNYNLLAHMRKIHSEQGEKKKPAVEHDCFFCHVKMGKKGLFSHYEQEHDCNLQSETLKFLDMAEFLSWKENMEINTKSKYILERGSETCGNSKRHYYVCHRSGVFQSENTGLRNLKIQGSCKIGYLCPASLKVVESCEGRCSVQYVKMHVGHINNLSHLTLTVQDRQVLAEKIAQKLPFKVILDEIRNSVSSVSGLQRIHLLSLKDLHNIKKQFNLNSNGVLHQGEHLKIANANDESEFLMKHLEVGNSSYDSSLSLKDRLDNVEQHMIQMIHSVKSEEEYKTLQKLIAPIEPTLKSYRSNMDVPESS